MLTLTMTSTRDIELCLRRLRIEAIAYDDRLENAPEGYLPERSDGFVIGAVEGYLVENCFCDSNDAKGFSARMRDLSAVGASFDVSQKATDCAIYLAGAAGKVMKLLKRPGQMCAETISGVFVIETIETAPGAPREMLIARMVAEVVDYARAGFIVAIHQPPYKEVTAHEALAARKTLPKWGRAARAFGMKAIVASAGAAIERREPTVVQTSLLQHDRSFAPGDFMTVIWALDDIFDGGAGDTVWDWNAQDNAIVEDVAEAAPQEPDLEKPKMAATLLNPATQQLA